MRNANRPLRVDLLWRAGASAGGFHCQPSIAIHRHLELLPQIFIQSRQSKRPSLYCDLLAEMGG